MLITSSMVPRKRRLRLNWFFGGVRIAGAFLVSGLSLLAVISRVFSRDLPRCGDRVHCKKVAIRADILFLSFWNSPEIVRGMLRIRCGAGWTRCGAGRIRCGHCESGAGPGWRRGAQRGTAGSGVYPRIVLRYYFPVKISNATLLKEEHRHRACEENGRHVYRGWRHVFRYRLCVP